jgi:hypothetical protein
MNTLIIRNRTHEQRRAAIVRAVNMGEAEPAARLDFDRLEDVWTAVDPRDRAPRGPRRSGRS